MKVYALIRGLYKPYERKPSSTDIVGVFKDKKDAEAKLNELVIKEETNPEFDIVYFCKEYELQ